MILTQKTEWPSFSKVEFINAINKYIINIINIANSCINLGYWPSHFKKLMLIIIPKPNKPFYNTSKTFQYIILFNTIGKLTEKVLSNKIQVYSITSNFIYPNQMGGIRQ